MITAGARRHTADVLLVAVWSALSAGVGGLGVLVVRHVVLRQFVTAPIDVIWMAPVGHVAVFLALAALPALVALHWPRLVPLRAALFAFVLLGMFSLLLLIRPIHPYASLALAVGVGARLAQLWGSDGWPRVRPVLARASAVLLALSTLWGGGWRAVWIVRSWSYDRAAPRPPAGAPNVLLIVLDTFRASNLGVYGATRPTSPHLDRLAAGGTIFEHAVAASSWSLPSHGALFTGQWPSRLAGRWTHPLDASVRTLAETLRDAGWRTTGISGNYVYGSSESGLARGFLDYESYEMTPGQVLLTVPLLQTALAQHVWRSRSLREVASAVRHADLRVPFEPRRVHRTAPDVTNPFLDRLALRRDRPYFAFLNYFDAHELGDLKHRYRTMFDGGRLPLDQYDGALAFVDEWIGVLLDSLAARGVLDSTLVVVTADHGEQFGEHGLISHGNSLYMTLLHVPLILRQPGRVPAGRRIVGEVSLRDVPATILDLVGVRDSALPGVSLAAYWTGGGPTSPAIAEVERAGWPGNTEPTSKGPMRSVAWNGWHYIRNGDGTEELYRWIEDPDEARNLAGSPNAQAALADGRSRLAAVPGGYTDERQP